MSEGSSGTCGGRGCQGVCQPAGAAATRSSADTNAEVLAAVLGARNTARQLITQLEAIQTIALRELWNSAPPALPEVKQQELMEVAQLAGSASPAGISVKFEPVRSAAVSESTKPEEHKAPLSFLRGRRRRPREMQPALRPLLVRVMHDRQLSALQSAAVHNFITTATPDEIEKLAAYTESLADASDQRNSLLLRDTTPENTPAPNGWLRLFLGWAWEHRKEIIDFILTLRQLAV